MNNNELEARRVRARVNEIEEVRQALKSKNTAQADVLERQLADDEDELRATLRELALDAAAPKPVLSDTHKDSAIDVGLVRAKLDESLDGHLALAAKRVKASRGERMSDADYAAFVRAVRKAADIVEADQTLAAIEQRERRLAEIAVKERPTYGVGSHHSYFRDIASFTASSYSPESVAVEARLAAHSREVAYEMRKGSQYGKLAERVIREATRGEDAKAHEKRATESIREARAIGSGGGSTVSVTGGGAAVFVPPAIVFSDFAVYLQRAVFANQITVDDVPEYGMQISIPAVTSDAGVQNQGGDANQLNETDPGAAFVSTTLETFAGVVTISTQLYDRSGNESGYSYDRIIGKQLALDYAKSLDSYAITQATSNATTILYNSGSFALAGTSTTGGFIDKLAQAKANIRGTSGQYLEPSALFLAPTRWEYIAGWADAQGRPIILPVPGEAGKRPYGCTGLEWGGLDVYTDSNLAGISFGTTAEDMVLVADPSEVYLWRTQQPALQAYVSPSAGSLEVQVRLYGYGATLTRYADALQVISGTALSPVAF